MIWSYTAYASWRFDPKDDSGIKALAKGQIINLNEKSEENNVCEGEGFNLSHISTSFPFTGAQGLQCL